MFTRLKNYSKKELITKFKGMNQIEYYQRLYYQEVDHYEYSTLCIDIINTLVSKDANQSTEHLKELKQYHKDLFSHKYIVVKHLPNQKGINCCRMNDVGEECLCNSTLYMIKPYTFDFMRSTISFFEIICFSEQNQYETNQIITHLEYKSDEN